mgnify:FL=1
MTHQSKNNRIYKGVNIIWCLRLFAFGVTLTEQAC